MQRATALDKISQQPVPGRSRPRLTQSGGVMRELLDWTLLIVAIYALVNLATVRFIVQGASMYPNFDTGQFLVVSRINYILGNPEHGDVAVLHYPRDPQVDYIKRIVGVPGDTVEFRDAQLHVNGELIDESYINEPCHPSSCPNNIWQLGADEYFVLGDNRNRSSDSRAFGIVDRELIVGKAVFRYWPLSQFGALSAPVSQP